MVMDVGKRMYERIKNDLLRKLANLLDILSMIFSVVYIAYAIILWAFGFSGLILSIGLITVTIIFIFFCLYKLTFLNNNPKKSARTKRLVGRICRFSKHAMRLVALIFIIASLIGLQENNWLVITGAIFSFATLAIQVALEIFMVPLTKFVQKSVKNAVVDSVKTGVKEEIKETVNDAVKKVAGFFSKPSKVNSPDTVKGN